ncbi:hypothetical protein BC940DRAFT_176622 [Gongronella butleri]|nr:hypothetical protein BC940DRAFT_176622 [Gongronella butleri]
MIAGGGGGNHHPPNNHVVATPESPSSLSQQHASPEVYATETTLPLHDSELGFSDVAMLYSTTSSLPPHDYAGLPPSASFEQHAHIPPPHPPSAPPVTHEVANMDAGGYVDSDFHHDLSSSSLPAAVVAAAANASAPPASDNYTSMIQHQQHQQWMHLHMSRSYMGNDLSWIMHQRRQHHHLNHQMSPTASPSTSSDKSKEINAVPTSSSPSSASASLNSSASSSPAVVAANPPPPSLAQRPPPLPAPTHMPSHNDLPFSSSASSSLTHTHSHHHPHHHQHHHPHPHHHHQQQQQQQQPLHPSYVTHSNAVFAQQQPHHLAATQLETPYLPRTDHSSLLYSSDMISTSQPYTSLPIASSQSFSLDHPEWHPAQENSFF